MKCYHCKREACSKIGNSKGNILNALFNRGKCWKKSEIYLCRFHFDIENNTENEYPKE